MYQLAQPLPPSIPSCAEAGHHPHLVRTQGAPLRHHLGAPVVPTWHIECCRCQVATVPHPSRAIAESRWTDPAGTHRIPLSQLRRAREQFAAAALAA
jgi:hypothetical protein